MPGLWTGSSGAANGPSDVRAGPGSEGQNEAEAGETGRRAAEIRDGANAIAAQVNGLRGQTSIADRAEWDNYYIKNWSVWLDIKILFLTVPAVLRSSE